jgi:hypothetical protein
MAVTWSWSGGGWDPFVGLNRAAPPASAPPQRPLAINDERHIAIRGGNLQMHKAERRFPCKSNYFVNHFVARVKSLLNAKIDIWLFQLPSCTNRLSPAENQ